ncbi:hypothetical protein HJD18_03195 [Thermoleophilia bacterium SCSIO 60948]|nr:hypothetical protein HJD18_03195 [Thermoleophilia bacterium SCSIO 60948]
MSEDPEAGDEEAERERQPGEDRRSLQWSEPTGESSEGSSGAPATPAEGTRNVSGHVDSEGMAIGMESSEEVSPTGRGANQRVAPPGTRLEGATEPADVTVSAPQPGTPRDERSTPASQPPPDADGESD